MVDQGQKQLFAVIVGVIIFLGTLLLAYEMLDLQNNFTTNMQESSDTLFDIN